MSTRILFITRKWSPAVGGMETYSKRLSEDLARENEIETIALPGRIDGRSPSTLSLFWFGLHAAIKTLRRSQRFDVIHGADMAIWPLVLLAKLRNPRAIFALSAHGTDVAFAFRQGPLPALYRIYLRAGAKMLHDAKILANSRATASLLRELQFEKIAVIPLAADSLAINNPATLQNYVLFVGRLIERKGCAWFIRSVLPTLPNNIRLKVAGTVADQSERIALENHRVEYVGPVFGEDLAKLRRNAIAVIVPNIKQPHTSGFEGFGLTAVEGAADGGVVLASAVDGISDAVRHEETGFLLPPGDEQAWLEKIHEITCWPPERRSSFVNAAIKSIRTSYSWQRVAADTTDAYGVRKPTATINLDMSQRIKIAGSADNTKNHISAAIERLPPLLTGPVARSAYSTSVLRVFNIAIGFLTTVILARFLGAEGLGVYAFGASIAMMAATFSRQGIQTQITRLTAAYLVENDWPRLKGILQFGAVASMIGTGLCSAFAVIYFVLTGEDSALIQAGVFGAVLAPVLAIAAVFQGRLRGDLKNFRAYMPEFVIAPVITLTLTGVFLLKGVLTAQIALLAFAIGWVFAAFISFALARKVEPPSLKGTRTIVEWKHWLVGATTLTAASLISVTAGRIELVAMSSNFSTAEIGLYAIAFRFAQLATLPGFALSSGFGPMLAKLHTRRETESLHRRITLGAWMNFWGTLAAGIIISCGSWFLLPFLNAELLAARPLVFILCVGFILQSLAGRAGDILSMLGLAQVAAKASIGTFTLSLIAIVLLVPSHGAVAAAIITAITFVFHGILLSIIVAKKTGRRCDVFATVTQALRRRTLTQPTI